MNKNKIKETLFTLYLNVTENADYNVHVHVSSKKFCLVK